jgi:hypothetical protein
MGARNADGVWTYVPRTYTSPIENLLQAAVSDLDPAQNPPGTRWFLAGNIFVVGDQDVSNNSRWVEISPHFNGSQFTFTYPNGTAGQFDFRTIPGLVVPTPPGPAGQRGHGVAGDDARLLSAVVNALRLPSTGDIRLPGPTGSSVPAGGQRQAFSLASEVLVLSPERLRAQAGGALSGEAGTHHPAGADSRASDAAFSLADLFGGI